MKNNIPQKMFNLTVSNLRNELIDFNRMIELEEVKVNLQKKLKTNNKKETKMKI